MKSGIRKVKNFRQEQPSAIKEIYYRYGTSYLLQPHIPILRYLNNFQRLCYLISNQNEPKIPNKKYETEYYIKSEKQFAHQTKTKGTPYVVECLLYRKILIYLCQSTTDQESGR